MCSSTGLRFLVPDGNWMCRTAGHYYTGRHFFLFPINKTQYMNTHTEILSRPGCTATSKSLSSISLRVRGRLHEPGWLDRRAGSVCRDDCSARYYIRRASPPAAKFRSCRVKRWLHLVYHSQFYVVLWTDEPLCVI